MDLDNFKIVNDNILGDLYFPKEDNMISSKIEKDGIYEEPEIDWLLKNIKENSVCLNVGSNVGYFSALMGRYSKNGSVISVEANPDLIKFLEKNVEKYNNVKVFNFAAGDTNGSCDLYLNSLNCGDNRILDPKLLKNSEKYYNDSMENYGFENEIKTKKIIMKKMDDLIKDRLDIVLIDTQGSDHLVIMGLEKTILNCHPKILVEYVPKWQDLLKEDGFDVVKYYLSLGYVVKTVGFGVEIFPKSDKDLYEVLKNNNRFFINLELFV